MYIASYEELTLRTFLVVQWLRLCISAAGGLGLIPGQGTKILHAAPHGQKKKKLTLISALWFSLCVKIYNMHVLFPAEYSEQFFAHFRKFPLFGFEQSPVKSYFQSLPFCWFHNTLALGMSKRFVVASFWNSIQLYLILFNAYIVLHVSLL